uniref:Uncharacterized protein n=1 Tax=Mycena chlorophos TaxID=658473 RepID=A0ABQ0M650_MYCCL|nr:predicted protein [Mycena chlorophos]
MPLVVRQHKTSQVFRCCATHSGRYRRVNGRSRRVRLRLETWHRRERAPHLVWVYHYPDDLSFGDLRAHERTVIYMRRNTPRWSLRYIPATMTLGRPQLDSGSRKGATSARLHLPHSRTSFDLSYTNITHPASLNDRRRRVHRPPKIGSSPSSSSTRLRSRPDELRFVPCSPLPFP